MFLVISGDFETAEMKSKVQQHFASFKPYKLEKRKRAVEPEQKSFVAKFEKSELQEQHLQSKPAVSLVGQTSLLF